MLVPSPRRPGDPARRSTLRSRDRVPARVLARARVRALVAGATVELHGPPTGLGSARGGTDGREAWA